MAPLLTLFFMMGFKPNLLVYGEGDVNLALNKTAYQRSTHKHQGNPAAARLAVGGNPDNEMDHGSCTHSLLTRWTWWVVDLEETYLITFVEITSRIFSVNDEPRLVDFKIETGNIWDNKKTFVLPSLCFYVTGRHGTTHGETVNYNCQEPVMGRYVRVQLQTKIRRILTLCEVRVFGTNKERRLDSTARWNKKGNSTVILSTLTRSKLTCAKRCIATDGCTSINVKAKSTKSRACELVQEKTPADVKNEYNAEGWIHYVLV